MFLGSCTVVLALICFALLGSPKEVIWLNKEEKRMAAARILRNKAGRDVTGVKWTWPQVGEAFRDPQLWFCTLNAFLSSVPNGYEVPNPSKTAIADCHSLARSRHSPRSCTTASASPNSKSS